MAARRIQGGRLEAGRGLGVAGRMAGAALRSAMERAGDGRPALDPRSGSRLRKASANSSWCETRTTRASRPFSRFSSAIISSRFPGGRGSRSSSSMMTGLDRPAEAAGGLADRQGEVHWRRGTWLLLSAGHVDRPRARRGSWNQGHERQRPLVVDLVADVAGELHGRGPPPEGACGGSVGRTRGCFAPAPRRSSRWRPSRPRSLARASATARERSAARARASRSWRASRALRCRSRSARRGASCLLGLGVPRDGPGLLGRDGPGVAADVLGDRGDPGVEVSEVGLGPPRRRLGLRPFVEEGLGAPVEERSPLGLPRPKAGLVGRYAERGPPGFRDRGPGAGRLAPQGGDPRPEGC